MNEQDVNETSVEQPIDPFKGDGNVTAEQPEQTVLAQTENVETQAQAAQPEAVAAVEDKPKWVKVVKLVSTIFIAAAGLLASLFMCLIGVKYSAGGAASYMLADVIKELNDLFDALTAMGNSSPDGELFAAILFDAYLLIGMLLGIGFGIVCGIILIIKTVRHFVSKKEVGLEKTAITAVLFFFAISVMVLGLANREMSVGPLKVTTQYGGATLAGLILCGILFALYFIGKIAENYKKYLSDKKTLINGCMNLGWAVVAVIVFAVLSCASVALAVNEMGVKGSVGFGFNHIFTNALGVAINNIDSDSEELILSLAAQYSFGSIGMIIHIWFIFQTGKSLHGAMRGTVSADKTVKLGTQIWRLVFAVLYLIVSIVLAQELIKTDYEGCRMVIAAPVVILLFSVIGLVIAIVNKILVREKVDKSQI